MLWWLLPGLLPACLCYAEILVLWGKSIPGVLWGRIGTGVHPSEAFVLPVPQKGDWMW